MHGLYLKSKLRNIERQTVFLTVDTDVDNAIRDTVEEAINAVSCIHVRHVDNTREYARIFNSKDLCGSVQSSRVSRGHGEAQLGLMASHSVET